MSELGARPDRLSCLLGLCRALPGLRSDLACLRSGGISAQIAEVQHVCQQAFPLNILLLERGCQELHVLRKNFICLLIFV